MTGLIPPLTRFGVHKPVPTRLLMMAMIVAGVFCGVRMQREFFPRTESDRARIVLPYPGATPEEIEESMARKVEDAVADLKEVDKIDTVIGEGVGVVVVRFRDGVRLRDGVDEVQTAIDSLQDLPADADRIRVQKLEPNIPVIMVALAGDHDVSGREEAMKRSIRDMADELRTLPGMGTVLISGARDYEIRIDVAEAALLEHGVSLPRIADTVTAWMRDIPGGSVRTGTGVINVRTLGVEERAEAIREIVVKATRDGQSLRLGDIATVRDGFVDEQVERRFNGKPAVSLTVFKTGDQDAIDIAEMVRGYVAGREGRPYPGGRFDRWWKPSRLAAYELGRRNPEQLPGTITPHSDLARLIEGRLGLLTDNAIQGAILIFIAVAAVLNLRTGAWVVNGLFTALCGTLLFMTFLGVTLNLLTMFGLLITLGMLEDDAIVVSENIVARHERGESPSMAAINGAEQVFWPVMGTVLTTIVAFLPLTFVRGPVGDLLAALPLVVLCALVVSVIETMMVLPSHMAHSLEKRDRSEPGPVGRTLERCQRWRDRAIVQRVIDGYVWIMRFTLEYRYVTTCVALATLVISLGMIAGGRLPFTFLPTNDSETVVLDVRMPVGTPLAATEALVRRFERAAMDQPEMQSVSAIVGERADVETALTDAPATNVAQIFFELTPVETRTRESTRVMQSIRDAIGPAPEAEELRFMEISGGPGGTDITIEVRGQDRHKMLAAVDDVKLLLAEFKGVRDIADDDFDASRELQVALRPAGASMGFTVADVARQLRGTLFGIDAHVFSLDREDIDVRVRLDENVRRRIDAIERLWVIAPDGRPVPLAEIAELRDGSSFSTIRRVDRMRTISVLADCDVGVNPEDVTAAVTARLGEIERDHPGVQVVPAGRAQDLSDAMSSLPTAFAAAMLMIYVILAWLFSSYTQPFAVMVAIPFAVIGMVWGHLLMGYQLDFLSLIGFVALSGVVVNNSLVFVEFFNEKRAAGMGLRESLVDSGRQRLRPIVLTSVTTFVGLAPLMFERSFQAKFLIPMAISIAFGLLSSTALTLLVLPCILVILDDLKAAAHWLWHGRPRGDAVVVERSAPLAE